MSVTPWREDIQVALYSSTARSSGFTPSGDIQIPSSLTTSPGRSTPNLSASARSRIDSKRIPTSIFSTLGPPSSLKRVGFNVWFKLL